MTTAENTLKTEFKKIKGVDQAQQEAGQSKELIKKAESIKIASAEDYEKCASVLTEIKSREKYVDDEFLKPLRESKRLIESVRKTIDGLLMAPLVRIEFTLKQKQLDWTREQRQIAEEQQRKLQAEADAKAEKERLAAIKKAEKLKTPELKEERLQEAEEISAPIVNIEPEVPKIEGQSIRKTWKAKIVDEKAFVRAALDNPALWGFIQINQSALDTVARSTKGQIAYPGIEFYEEESMAVSGRTIR